MDAITGFLMQALFVAIWLSVIAVLSFAANKIVKIILFKNLLQTGLRKGNVVLLIKIPPTNEQKEQAMEEFLQSLHRLLPNKANVSFELASSNQFLRFYIVIAKQFKTILESQLYAQYPEAEIEEVEDYLPKFAENTAFLQLHFRRPSIAPIKTYSQNQEDLLKNLSSILSKTEADEQVYLQLCLRRIGSKGWQRGIRAILFEFFGKKYQAEDTPTATQQKLSQDLYTGKLRLAYVANQHATAEAKLVTIAGLFKLVKGPDNELKKKAQLLPDYISRAFPARQFDQGDLWSCAELATLYHFPYEGAVVTNVVNTTSKRAPAPDILPFLGQVDPKAVSFIGETNYHNERKTFGIKRIDRRRHVYIVGKTGSGKSRLMELLLIADIINDKGCCLLDPHGDLADELLHYVPKHRINDVVYVNPADRDFPIGFNPLEPVDDYEARQHLSTFFIAIFKKMFAANWNSRMEHLIRYITLALLETEDSSVLGIPRMLSDTSFRQRVIQQIQDPVVKSFWTNEFASSNEQFSNEAVVPILNKVGQFISNPIIRNMVGQRKNVLNFENFMNEGKIVILNISKGKLGDENAALLGSMVITKIQQAALARAKVAEEERPDFYFYVDEFQNFATDAFSSILSEARKYHLNLTIAHQYIAQLPDEVKATAFGNVGTIVAFAIGGDDAAYLGKEFAPTFSPSDMINLNTREMYIKMSIDGKLTPPFSARTIDIPKTPEDYSDTIVDRSRVKYGRNRTQVENEINRWSTSSGQVLNSSDDTSFPEPII